VIFGIRFGLYGTIVHRPSSPAVLIYTRSETIFILVVQRLLLHGWLTGAKKNILEARSFV
jgi:hypothetical protein